MYCIASLPNRATVMTKNNGYFWAGLLKKKGPATGNGIFFSKSKFQLFDVCKPSKTERCSVNDVAY